MRIRAIDASGVLFAIVLGLVAGPLAFLALAGDYMHIFTGIHSSLPSSTRYITGGSAAILIVLGLINAGHYRNAGAIGAITGAAAGVGELVLSLVPWLLYTHGTHPNCQSGGICPLPSTGDLEQLTLTIGIYSIVIGTIAGFSLATLLTVVRRRLA
jgi:hypothetical protein